MKISQYLPQILNLDMSTIAVHKIAHNYYFMVNPQAFIISANLKVYFTIYMYM